METIFSIGAIILLSFSIPIYKQIVQEEVKKGKAIDAAQASAKSAISLFLVLASALIVYGSSFLPQ